MTNEPAFPQALTVSEDGRVLQSCDYGYGGMTLRDYFAAKALQAMCSGEKWPLETDGIEMARRAYVFADAMCRATPIVTVAWTSSGLRLQWPAVAYPFGATKMAGEVSLPTWADCLRQPEWADASVSIRVRA